MAGIQPPGRARINLKPPRRLTGSAFVLPLGLHAREIRPPPPCRPAPLVLPGTVYITRQVHFSAAHQLYNPTKSLAWNQQQYGRCTKPRCHGHNYVLEVTVCGRPSPDTGFIMDLAELKRVLHRAGRRPLRSSQPE
jgi:hypothetical protein